MVRWTAFDDRTAAALASTVASGTAEICDGDPLEFALQDYDSTLLLPTNTPGQVLLLRLRVNRRTRTPAQTSAAFEPPTAAPAEESVALEATGFLGLSDAPIYLDEAPAPRKWWQKLLD